MTASDPPRPLPAAVFADAVAREAVAWFVRLQADDADPGMRAKWQAWLQSDAEHARAWRHLQECAGTVAGLSPALAHSTLLRRPPRTRREFLKSVLLLSAGAGGAYWAARSQPWQPLLADHHTGVGHPRRLELPDGSFATLDTDSAIDVHFGHERRIHLLRGEVYVQALARTASGGAPPPRFTAQTRHGAVWTPGCRFTLAVQASHSTACAIDGELAVVPADAPDAGLRLQAGMRTTFTAGGAGQAQSLDKRRLAWRDGLLAAHDMRLQAFAAELARYRPGAVHCDPEVADLRVSGVFPLSDTDRILDTLALTLPVRVRTLTRYWVAIGPRPAA